jgi:hypothetical protein
LTRVTCWTLWPGSPRPPGTVGTSPKRTIKPLSDQMPFVSEQAEARYWYARMLVDRDLPEDRRKAKELLETALAIYHKVGMPWHITRAESLAIEALG